MALILKIRETSRTQVSLVSDPSGNGTYMDKLLSWAENEMCFWCQLRKSFLGNALNVREMKKAHECYQNAIKWYSCSYNLCVFQIKGFSTKMRPWNTLRSDLTAFTAEGHRAKWIAHPPAAASPQIHVVHLTNHGKPSIKIIASWCKRMRRMTRYAITGLSQWWKGIYYSTIYGLLNSSGVSEAFSHPLCQCLHSICKNVPILLRLNSLFKHPCCQR